MPWSKTGANHYNAQLGLPDKVLVIKGLVILMAFDRVIIFAKFVSYVDTKYPGSLSIQYTSNCLTAYIFYNKNIYLSILLIRKFPKILNVFLA